MKKLVIIILALSCSSVFAKGEKSSKVKQELRKPASMDCPIKMEVDGYVEKVKAAIKTTDSCYIAKSMAESCQVGDSMDVDFAVSAERKCGLDFWKKMSKQEETVYDSLQAKCDGKYRNTRGTMYVSAAAFCRLNVAALYSDLYTIVTE